MNDDRDGATLLQVMAYCCVVGTVFILALFNHNSPAWRDFTMGVGIALLVLALILVSKNRS